MEEGKNKVSAIGNEVLEISKLIRNLTIFTFENKIRRRIESKKITIDNVEFISIKELNEIFLEAKKESMSDNLVKRNE